MKPTYWELVQAFYDYLAASNNQGDPCECEECDIERAYEILERTGIPDPYAFGCNSG
jgi:hypothetical protein